MNNVNFQSDFETPKTAAEKVRVIAARIFQVDASSVTLEMGPDDIESWDSLNHLRLITEIESTFAVHLSMQQIQNIHSLDDVVRVVG
jgi:acyl carrier protein